MRSVDLLFGQYRLYEDGRLVNISTKRELKGCRGEYITVKLGGRMSTSEYLHRLVAKNFIANPDNKPCVNHINGNKYDNRADNLQWVTYSENHKHAYDKLGKKTPAGRYLGGGVCFDKHRNKWMAYTDYHGKRKYHGRYDDKDLARLVSIEARDKIELLMEQEYGYNG